MTDIKNIHLSVEIREACLGDVPGILEMVAELAEFEHLADQLVATCLLYTSPSPRDS